jgi:hypothetical protein
MLLGQDFNDALASTHQHFDAGDRLGHSQHHFRIFISAPRDTKRPLHYACIANMDPLDQIQGQRILQMP